VDAALQVHLRALSTRRETVTAWLQRNQGLPTAQTPFVSEADCALFHELLPRFLPTGSRKTVNAVGLTEAFNKRVANEYLSIQASSGACNARCCSAPGGSVRGCSAVSAKMMLRLKTVNNVTDYITKVGKLVGTKTAIAARQVSMIELSTALKKSTSVAAPATRLAERSAPIQPVGEDVVGGSVLSLPPQTLGPLLPGLPEPEQATNLPVPGQMAPNDLIRRWGAAAILELNTTGHATAAAVCDLVCAKALSLNFTEDQLPSREKLRKRFQKVLRR